MKRTKLKPKICSRCGTENSSQAEACSSCNSSRFAPSWVLAKRPINRQVGIEVTETNPEFGPIQKRITLSKWWPGGKANFHIPSPAQWNEIERIINEDLSQYLGWKSKRELLKTVREGRQEEKLTNKELGILVQDHPDIIARVAQALDPKKLAQADFDDVLKTMDSFIAAFQTVDAGFKKAFLHIVERLPKERKQALEQLEDLLGKWSLQQITTVGQQVRGRLETIELFKHQVMDERTYEIRGKKSIHRILESAMWLVDERYWLLQSNETLLHFIGEQMGKLDKKKFGKKRPDFLCGTVGDKLIIIEIKRPSHELTPEDLNQLETYVAVAENYMTFRSYEAYLIGSKISDDLIKRTKYRASNFKVWTYSNLIADTESRYRKYIRGGD